MQNFYLSRSALQMQVLRCGQSTVPPVALAVQVHECCKRMPRLARRCVPPFKPHAYHCISMGVALLALHCLCAGRQRVDHSTYTAACACEGMAMTNHEALPSTPRTALPENHCAEFCPACARSVTRNAGSLVPVRTGITETRAVLSELVGRVQVVHEALDRPRNIQYKGDTDLVTDTDKAAEAACLQQVQAAFSDHAILGEEGGVYGNTASQYLWCIDPLDGTTNFAHAYPSFAVSIGVLRNAVPVAACVVEFTGGAAPPEPAHLAVPGPVSLSRRVTVAAARFVALDVGQSR